MFGSVENYIFPIVGKCLGNFSYRDKIGTHYQISLIRRIILKWKANLKTGLNNLPILCHISENLLKINDISMAKLKLCKLRSSLNEITSIFYLSDITKTTSKTFRPS